ncbi:MAG: NAD(P)-binding protein [Gammaproteobacteria bacterium]
MNPRITRRDFIGSTLIGSGAALLSMKAPGLIRSAQAREFELGKTVPHPLTGLGPEWTGPGGIGDYADANGNTHEVVNAAHQMRNRNFGKMVDAAEDTGETYDLVIVGAGFAGLGSAYRYNKECPDDSVLLFDMHAIFGGEAKQNEFEVDGHRLWGPQGSNGNVYPIKKALDSGWGAPLWRELGLPEEFTWQDAKNLSKDIRIPYDVYSPMHISWESADQGFFYDDHGFVINPWKNRFREAPIPEQMKQDLIWMEVFRQPPRRDDWRQWLDSMTYQRFLEKIMGIKSDVASYLNPQMAAMGCGMGTDVASAYSAYSFMQPGVNAYDRYQGVGDLSDQIWLASWPGGNTGQLRYIVKNIIPGAFPGGMELKDVLFGPVQWQNLDRPNQPVRMRLSSMVVDVRHEGSPEKAQHVRVTYMKDGKLRRVRAKKVIAAGQQHSNKRIVSDLPGHMAEAMDAFMHAPICTVNVALRNWKFLEKLGVSAVRWFGEFGWFFSLRRQMIIDGEEPMPLDPDKPIVLTMYNSFCMPGLAPAQQTVAARMKLFSMSFADIERAVRDQFTKMFADYGFNADRDIAGIVANRWGHAYVVCPPHFYFGKNGQPAPRDVVREGYGRIRFAHSELEGTQMWETAIHEGERAVRQVLESV